VFANDTTAAAAIQDASGNRLDSFSQQLEFHADPQLISENPIYYTDDSHNGSVDHIYVIITEEVYFNAPNFENYWDININDIGYGTNPVNVLFDTDARETLALDGFTVPPHLTYFNPAELSFSGTNLIWDGSSSAENPNYADTFTDLNMADEAAPVVYVVNPVYDPIFLGSTQHLDIIFTELVDQTGVNDPVVTYDTPFPSTVTCSTSPEWVAYEYSNGVYQSQYNVDADTYVSFGETGTANVYVEGAVDLSGNTMHANLASDFTFAIDARAAKLVTDVSGDDLVAGLPFEFSVLATDLSGTLTDIYYDEYVEFSSNKNADQVLLPQGQQPMVAGEGIFQITPLEPMDDLRIYVHEVGNRINNSGTDGPFVVVAPTIDAPDTSWVQDAPEDQGN